MHVPGLRRSLPRRRSSLRTSAWEAICAGATLYVQLSPKKKEINGVEFSIELLEWGRTFSDFWGKKILLNRDSKWSRLKSSDSCCLLNVTITSHYIPFLKPQLQY